MSATNPCTQLANFISDGKQIDMTDRYCKLAIFAPLLAFNILTTLGVSKAAGFQAQVTRGIQSLKFFRHGLLSLYVIADAKEIYDKKFIHENGQFSASYAAEKVSFGICDVTLFLLFVEQTGLIDLKVSHRFIDGLSMATWVLGATIQLGRHVAINDAKHKEDLPKAIVDWGFALASCLCKHADESVPLLGTLSAGIVLLRLWPQGRTWSR